MGKLEGKAAIVGIGEVPTGRFPDKAAITFGLESAKLAIRDAGIDKDEIDFCMPTAALFSPPFNTELVTCRMVEELGLKELQEKLPGVFRGIQQFLRPSDGAAAYQKWRGQKLLFVHSDKLGTGVTASRGD